MALFPCFGPFFSSLRLSGPVKKQPWTSSHTSQTSCSSSSAYAPPYTPWCRTSVCWMVPRRRGRGTSGRRTKILPCLRTRAHSSWRSTRGRKKERGWEGEGKGRDRPQLVSLSLLELAQLLTLSRPFNKTPASSPPQKRTGFFCPTSPATSFPSCSPLLTSTSTLSNPALVSRESAV